MSAVSKHIKCKVDWKEEIGHENEHKQQGWTQAWEYCQAKPIQTLGRASQGVNWSWSQCIKSYHTQTSSGKGLPSHFWNRNMVSSILPGLRRKRTGLLLSGPKSSFQMTVNFAFHLEIKVSESGGRVECEVSTVSDDWAVPQADCLHASIDAVIHAKGGPTKYWVHRNEHTFQKPDISV